jgi:hypothetical protein
MRSLALFAALALAACQTPCPSTGAEVRMTMHCEDGSDLGVTFTPDQAVVVQEGYVTLTLPVRVAGGGYRYAGNGAELRGRASESHWTRPGAAETLCRRTE